MELLYPQEHLSCLNYQNGDRPLIECKKLSEQQHWEESPKVHKIIFIVDGELEHSYENQNKKNISKGNVMLIPAGYKISCKALTDVSLVVFRINKEIQLCDRFPLSRLSGVYDDVDGLNIGYLEMKDCTWNYINDLTKYILHGFKCYHYFDLKINEFMFILRGFYSKEELFLFFYPLISSDTGFTHQVLLRYQQAKNVQELAALTNYSVSGFEKHFKKAFGVSAGKWLKERRAINIYHEINSSQKSLKSICSDFGFSSITYFNDYCKRQFGVPPGEIRKQISKKPSE